LINGVGMNTYSKLCEIRDAFYDAYNADNHEAALNIMHEYDEAVNEAVAANPDKHCNEVDPWLWQEFSDWHKDEYGFRPTGVYTRDDVVATMPGRSQ
jgi:hypothetical protein